MIKKWVDAEVKEDDSLSLVRTLYKVRSVPSSRISLSKSKFWYYYHESYDNFISFTQYHVSTFNYLNFMFYFIFKSYKLQTLAADGYSFESSEPKKKAIISNDPNVVSYLFIFITTFFTSAPKGLTCW